ncbi:MAG: substrate-binding domain-containing protein [Planctomycetes bacterium]|nr:substrate-binding domain-containing protein [Planctomycetota bacterium]
MPARRTTRPARKQAEIDVTIRNRITSGVYPPGELLPRRADLQTEFSVSGGTIQQVFDALLADGFIATNGRGGTVVVERPPHLHRIAVVFPTEPRSSRFWVALANEARAMAERGERELVIYEGVDAREHNRDYARLLADARAQRLAGIVFASSPHDMEGSELLAVDIPRVAIKAGNSMVAMPGVYPDMDSFIARAVGHLVERGCQRVAALVVEGFPGAALRRELARLGCSPDPWLVQAVPLNGVGPTWARSLTQLLFQPGQRQLPDGLIIADDNLVEHALGGLVDAGVRVPAEVAVVAHCNFPWPAPSVLSVQRLGFDALQVLRACLTAVDQRLAGRPCAGHTPVAARFEDETESPAASISPA